MLRGSFDQSLWPQAFVVRALQPAVCLHGHLLLGHSRLPFASLQMLQLCSAAASTSLQTRKILRGGFDQLLWPQAFAVRAFKPAVGLHSHLLLGRSSLPFASLQMREMIRGSFDQPSNP